MKDIIIGACYNYSYDQIRCWINSINRCGFDGDKVVIIFDCTEELYNKVTAEGFKVLSYPFDENAAPHVQRFIAIYDYLQQNEYNNVITTDVRDVIFQRNPFDWLREHNFPKLVAGSECLKYEDEPWGNENIFQTFGEYIHSIYKNKTIYNVGVIGGQYKAVRDMCLDIAVNCVNRSIPICDQAVFNFTVHNDIFKDVIYYAQVKDLWAAHLGTLADPVKMPYFKPKLLEDFTLQFKDNKLLVNDEQVFIIHQYDRTLWREELEKIYG